ARAVATLQGHTSARLLRELRQTRAMLMELLAKVPDADLNSAHNAARAILGVALEHDREHGRQIQSWRRGRAESGGAPAQLGRGAPKGD
ncbi:MAG: hypothetical protein V3V06_00425, partial [Dehalococcoidia bacterium]